MEDHLVNTMDKSGDENDDLATVNPAPPPEATEPGSTLHSDAIGDTMFSERGVLRTLMLLNDSVPRYLGPDLERDATGEDGCPADRSDQLMELDDELEQQLCQLWDMAAEPAVAAFLGGSGLLEVVWPLLDRSPCPRLLEIVAGTLANCAVHGPAALPGGAACAAAAAGRLLVNSRGDALVLRETLRLLQAAGCAQPRPEPLLEALAGWLPLLADLLERSLSAPLLQQALSLLAAVATLPGKRRWWLRRLATEAPRLPAALLEGLAQLLALSAGAADVPAEQLLGTCRDTLRLLAELHAELLQQDATEPDAWLGPVDALLRAAPAARPDADAAAGAEVACCLLWLAALGQRRQLSVAALSGLLRFCRAALAAGPGPSAGEPPGGRSGEPPGEPPAEPPGGPPGEPLSGPPGGPPDGPSGGSPGGPPCEPPSSSGGEPRVGAADESVDEPDELVELAGRLSATVALLARRCDAVPRFLAAGGGGARLFWEVLETRDPALAAELRAAAGRDAVGSHSL